jgi:subtilase family serine protease
MLVTARSWINRPGRARWQRRRQARAAACIAAALALAGCATGPDTDASNAAATAATSTAAGYACLPTAPGTTPPCYFSPQLLRTAYGVTPLLDRGIDGRGQSVVLPELAEAPGTTAATDIRQDVALFDRTYSLPAVNLKVTNLAGAAASPYLAATEEVGDVEMVHAIAPGATIQVVLAPTSSTSSTNNTPQFLSEIDEVLHLAPRLGGIVSISGGRGEQCATGSEARALNQALQADEDQHVTVIAADGDEGAASAPCTGSQGTVTVPQKGVNLPASDPLVLSVGGTSLQANHTTGTYEGESVWNTPIPSSVTLPPGLEPAVASGGGFSSLFARPAYQGTVPGIGAGTGRGVPDVAASASPDIGMAAILDLNGTQITGVADGTSAAAPFWAGIIALADQYAGRRLGLVNPAIYRIGLSSRYHRAFHDVTTGGNSVDYPSGSVEGYSATPGWDPVTGWGSPDAQALVPLLAAGD